MRLAAHPGIDALCGEYLLGTLRGAARRRFDRALREEPLVARRLDYWQGVIAPRYTRMMEAQPPTAVWNRLERELSLSRYRTPWHKRASFWRGWAVAATAALVLVLGLQFIAQEPPPAHRAAHRQGSGNAGSSRPPVEGQQHDGAARLPAVDRRASAEL